LRNFSTIIARFFENIQFLVFFVPNFSTIIARFFENIQFLVFAIPIRLSKKPIFTSFTILLSEYRDEIDEL